MTIENTILETVYVDCASDAEVIGKYNDPSDSFTSNSGVLVLDTYQPQIGETCLFNHQTNKLLNGIWRVIKNDATGFQLVRHSQTVTNSEHLFHISKGAANVGTKFRFNGSLGEEIEASVFSRTMTGAATNDIPLTDKGAANGVASLDADGEVPEDQLPIEALTSVRFVDNIVDMDEEGVLYRLRQTVGTDAAGLYLVQEDDQPEFIIPMSEIV